MSTVHSEIILCTNTTYTTLFITNWFIPNIFVFFIRILIFTGLDAAPCSIVVLPMYNGSIESRPISGIPM